MIGALAGINMISGPGMLDFLACVSPEKLVIDAESIAMAKRMLEGMQAHTDPLAVGMYEGIDFKGDFLKQRLTGQLFKEEQHLPSVVIDRGSIRAWQAGGELDTFARAKTRLGELLAVYQPPEIPSGQEEELTRMVAGLAAKAGMDKLPELDRP